MRDLGLRVPRRGRAYKVTDPLDGVSTAPPTWSTALHGAERRTGSGWPTSPTSRRTPAGSTPPSSSMSSPGWSSVAASNSLRSDLAIDALRWRSGTAHAHGQVLDGLVHHSDRGVQYLSIRYSERLAENDIVASVGSTGDSYDNAMAEASTASTSGS